VSAAERLRELDEQATSRPWKLDFTHGGAWWAPDGYALASGEADGTLIVTLRNALSEIAAVVEAAEIIKWHYDQGVHQERAVPHMLEALHALSAKLDGAP
jgi:hypothetical protein